MKAYSEPFFELIKIENEDIIATSTCPPVDACPDDCVFHE